MKKVSK